MSIEIIESRAHPTMCAMYCTTSDVAFGPVFTSHEEAERFIAYCWLQTGDDPRGVEGCVLERLVTEMRKEEPCAL